MSEGSMQVRGCSQGTFLVRPSLSLAGAMVLSVVVDGCVKHMALDGNQLDTRSLEVRIPLPHARPACSIVPCIFLPACAKQERKR